MSGEPEDTMGDEVSLLGSVAIDASHDMRNVLSIISEYAGLLEDLLGPGDGRKRVDTARLRSISESIRRQVESGTMIMQRLSRFSHAADERVASFDLGALVANVAGLAARRISRSACRLETDIPEEPIPVRSEPFRIQHLIYHFVERHAGSTAEGGVVTLRLEKRGGQAAVSIAGLAPASTGEASALTGRLASSVRDLRIDIESGRTDGVWMTVLLIPLS